MTQQSGSINSSAGSRFRQAVAENKPLQVVGTITAFAARLAERAGHKAIYLSGGGLAANSLGMPDLGISALEDVLTDTRRITDVCSLPLLVDADTGFGGAFNIARTTRSLIKAGAAAMHIEDQVAEKRCGHRPNKAIVSQQEMMDRIKAAADARDARAERHLGGFERHRRHDGDRRDRHRPEPDQHRRRQDRQANRRGDDARLQIRSGRRRHGSADRRFVGIEFVGPARFGVAIGLHVGRLPKRRCRRAYAAIASATSASPNSGHIASEV